jgi:hypothetical protein
MKSNVNNFALCATTGMSIPKFLVFVKFILYIKQRQWLIPVIYAECHTVEKALSFYKLKHHTNL